jgi:IS30 family transposase
MHSHLTQHQRIELSLLMRLGYSLRAAAVVLGVSPSTVCRELQRNCKTGSHYHATYARMQTVARRLSANQALRKLHVDSPLTDLIADKLALEQWSPDQIAHWLKRGRHAARVCAQTIYDWLYTTRKDLLQYLRSQKQRYRRTRANTAKSRPRSSLLRPLGG